MTREEAIKHIITYAYYADDIPMQVATALEMETSAVAIGEIKKSCLRNSRKENENG